VVVERLGVAEFLERAGAFLLAREAQHGLILGLAARLLPNPRLYGSDPYLAVVETDGRVVATALRTPPYGLILSEIDDAGAVGAIAADVHEVFDSLPGVYTPPELRGRGYASALVAELTASLLAGGRKYCFLFTNLANPTSNSIYQQVGYHPVTEVDQWLFDQRASTNQPSTPS
jgi:ribosomal protein S18 acetylase RimI-like enzyme